MSICYKEDDMRVAYCKSHDHYPDRVITYLYSDGTHYPNGIVLTNTGKSTGRRENGSHIDLVQSLEAERIAQLPDMVLCGDHDTLIEWREA